MLETIHEYALERLAQSGEEQQIQDRHLKYILSLAESMESGYRRQNQLLLLARTEAEMGNLRAAFRWAIASEAFETAARLVSAVDYYFRYQEHRIVEGYRWFKQVLPEMDKIPRQFQVRLLLGAGRLAWVNGDVLPSVQFHQQALDIARKLGDHGSEAWLLTELAISSSNLPEKCEEAQRYNEKGLAIFLELDDKPGIAYALNIQGEILRLAGDFERAQEAYEESLVISYETGESYRQWMLLADLGFIAYSKGEYKRAKELATSCIRQQREANEKPYPFNDLFGLAGPLAQLGEPEKAARLLGASTALMEMIGSKYQPSDLPEFNKYITDVQAQLDEPTFEAAWAEGQSMTIEEAIDYALEE